MARHVQEAGHEKLAYILRMAGSEALIHKAVFVESDMAIGTFDWDIEKNLGFIDPVASALLGLDPVEASRGLPPERYYAVIHPDDLPRMLTTFSKAVAGGGPFEFHFRVVNAAFVRPVRLTGHVVSDEIGHLTRIAGLIFDLSAETVSEAETKRV